MKNEMNVAPSSLNDLEFGGMEPGVIPRSKAIRSKPYGM